MVIHFPDLRDAAPFVKSRPRLLSSYDTDKTLSNMPRMLHSHPHLEIFYIYEGKGGYLVDGQNYTVSRGDLIIFNAGVLHGELAQNPVPLHSYCIALTDVNCPAMQPDHLAMPGIVPIIRCGEDQALIETLMRALCHTEDRSSLRAPSAPDDPQILQPAVHSGDRLSSSAFPPSAGSVIDEANSRFCGALAYSVLVFCHNRLGGQHVPVGKARAEIVQAAKDYIDEHFTEELDFDALAEQLHISKYYFSHSFKRVTQYAPKQYQICRRIGEAQTLLMNTQLPVSEIGSRTGYPDACQFNTIFKKHVGLTPGRYRRAFLSYEESAFVY